MIVKEFTRDLDLLLFFLRKLNNNLIDNNLLNYIRFSPFISNKIWWRKQLQEILEKIYELKVKEVYSHLNMPNNLNIEFFIKINKVLPYYRYDKSYWINMMFFSEANIIYYLKKWVHNFFLWYDININYLDYEDIVMSWDTMYKLVLRIINDEILRKKILIDVIKSNNLILMLLSDYKDILYKIREKKYLVNEKKINKRLSSIERKTWVSKDELMSLDYFILMKENTNILRKITI